MKDFKLAVGLRLRGLRQGQKLPLRVVAGKLGMSSVALCYIETGRNMPVVRLQDLAQLYGATLRSLFADLDIPQAKNEKDLPLVRLVETEMGKAAHA